MPSQSATSTAYSPVVETKLSVISAIPFLDLIPVVSVPIESQMDTLPALVALEIMIFSLTVKLLTFTPTPIV